MGEVRVGYFYRLCGEAAYLIVDVRYHDCCARLSVVDVVKITAAAHLRSSMALYDKAKSHKTAWVRFRPFQGEVASAPPFLISRRCPAFRILTLAAST